MIEIFDVFHLSEVDKMVKFTTTPEDVRQYLLSLKSLPNSLLPYNKKQHSHYH